MEHNYQNIIKKSYAKPVIEEVMIDCEMSLVMESQPVNPDDPTDPIEPAPPGPKQSGLSTYKSASLPSPTSPFGTSPEY